MIGAIKQPNDYAIASKSGKAASLEIFTYSPHAGESIFVDNIRLTSAKAAVPPKRIVHRCWNGLDAVRSIIVERGHRVGKKLKEKCDQAVIANPVADHEAEMQKQLAELKAKHPLTVLSVFATAKRATTQPTRQGLHRLEGRLLQ